MPDVLLEEGVPLVEMAGNRKKKRVLKFIRDVLLYQVKKSPIHPDYIKR